MKKVLLLSAVVFVNGCATHANIEMPFSSKVHSESWKDKAVVYDVFYSQPEPGIFTGGTQMPMLPLSEAKLSVASATVLGKMPQLIEQQLPIGASVSADPSQYDYKLVVEMTARNKRGPSYAEHEFGKSVLKSLFTLGLGSSEYNIIADFDVNYKLLDQGGQEVSAKEYRVSETVDHERGKLESISSTYDFAALLLEKHMTLTLNNFFQTAALAD